MSEQALKLKLTHKGDNSDDKKSRTTAKRGFTAVCTRAPGFKTEIDPVGILMNRPDGVFYSIDNHVVAVVHEGYTDYQAERYVQTATGMPSFDVLGTAEARSKRGKHLLPSVIETLPLLDGYMQPDGDVVKIKAIVLTAGSGKTTLSADDSRLIDIDDIIDAPKIKKRMKDLRGKALQDGNWDPVNAANGEALKDWISKNPGNRDKVFLIHDANMFGPGVKVEKLFGARLRPELAALVASKRSVNNKQWAEATMTNNRTSKEVAMTHAEIKAGVAKALSAAGIPRHSSDVRLVVWIQGSILLKDGDSDRLNPRQTVDKLKHDLSGAVVSRVEWVVNSWFGRSPGHLLREMRNRGHTDELVFWTKQEHNASQYNTDYQKLKSEFGSRNPLTQYVYKDGDVERVYSDLLADLRKWIHDAETREMPGEADTFDEEDRVKVATWWSKPGVHMRTRIQHSHPRPLPVQFSRHSSHGLVYIDETVQLVPPAMLTSLFDEGAVQLITTIDTKVTYYHYEPSLSMVKIKDAAFKGYDFVYVRRPGGGYRMALARDADPEKSYVVEHPLLCHGWGSVITAWHSALGVGSSTSGRLIRAIAERESGKEGVQAAGHVIHMLLAHEAHYQWARYEMAYNLKRKRSVYIAPFAENQKGQYHTIDDYNTGLRAAENLIPEARQGGTTINRRVSELRTLMSMFQ